MNGGDSTGSGFFAPAGLWRAVAYRSLWRAAALIRRASNGLTNAATGVLSRNDLKMSSQELWSTFCLEIDEVDAGLEGWEQRMYEVLLRPGDRVFLVGCGTGRNCWHFVRWATTSPGAIPVRASRTGHAGISPGGV